MTIGSRQPSSDAERDCGACSLCCTVLRVDELAKLGGRACMHQRAERGCAVYARRPGICRAYRCAWLGGAFDEADRPDRLGAVLDLVPRGDTVRLVIRQADPAAWSRSARLREIALEMRRSMTVEVRDVGDVLDPKRPFRVLQPDGTDLRIAGDFVEVLDGDRVTERRRKSSLERFIARLETRIAAWRLSRWPAHEDRAGVLADPPPD